MVSVVRHDDKPRDDFIREVNSEIQQLKSFPDEHKESLYLLCVHQDIKDTSNGCTDGMIKAIGLIKSRKV